MRRWRWFNFSLQINKYFLCSLQANESLTNFPKRVLISCDSKGESRAVGTWEPIQGKPSPPVTWKEAVWGLLLSKPAFCLMLITKCKKVAGRSSIYEPADEVFFLLIIIDRQTDMKSKTVLIKFKLQTSCWPLWTARVRHNFKNRRCQKERVRPCIHLRHLAKIFSKNLFW